MQKSSHNLSHTWTGSTNMGLLMPCFLMEVLPGDSVRISTNVLMRYNTILRPLMHVVSARVHFWFVPLRTIWDQFEEFMTNADSGITVPTITFNDTTPPGAAQQSLAGAFGVVRDSAEVLTVSALPVRSYNAIYNRYYRDQKLNNAVGQDDNFLRYLSWGKDYYTKARNEVQQGTVETLSVAQDIPITEVRDKLQVQRWREHRSQFGERYFDLIASLGIKVPEERLQDPEYLGMVRAVSSFADVVATAEAGNQKVGSYTGHGLGAVAGALRRKFFVEHGYIVGLLSLRPMHVMGSGVAKHWYKRDWNDYFQPELARQTQDEVWLGEVAANTDDSKVRDVWGYTGKYENYRSIPSNVSRTMFVTANRPWTFARYPSVSSSVDGTFVQCRPDPTPFDDQTDARNEVFFFCSHGVQTRRIVGRRPK